MFGVHWVFPKSVKEALFSWRGSFVGQKEENDLELYSPVNFLDGLEGA